MLYRLKHIILLLICLYSSTAVAQVVNKAGYIITLENDTLYGIIESRNNTRNRKECRFTGDNGTVVYTPRMISGYGFVNGKFFTSRVVDDTFLQVLISGELSLYKDGPVYYLGKKGDEVLKLQYREKTDTVEGNIYTREDLTWKGYVNMLVHDCIQDPDVISKLSMEERDLTRFVINYNICKGVSHIDYLAEKPWTRVELGISSGITRSLVEINNKTGPYLYLPDNYMSYDPSFGLIFILSSPRFMNRLAFQSGIEFIKSDFFSEIIRTYPTITIFHNTYIRFTTLSFAQSVRYTVIDRKYRLFINLGITLSKNIDCETRRQDELLTGSVVYTSSGQIPEIAGGHPGLLGGLEFQKSFDKFNAGVTFKYNRMNKIFSFGDFDSNITRLSLSLVISIK